MLYDSYMGVQAARCLGHGGVPVYQWHRADAPYPPPGSYEFRGKLSGHLEPWALFGFAVLDFRDERIEVRYINELGQEHHQEILV